MNQPYEATLYHGDRYFTGARDFPGPTREFCSAECAAKALRNLKND